MSTIKARDFRLFLVRSFFSLSPDATEPKSRDPRWSGMLDMLPKAGFDTDPVNLTEIRTELRLGPAFAESLTLLNHFAERACLFAVWCKQDEERDVIAFFEELDARWHDPVGQAVKLWFRETEKRAILSFGSRVDGSKCEIHVLPFQEKYEETDAILLSALCRRGSSSAAFVAVRPPSGITARVTPIPDDGPDPDATQELKALPASEARITLLPRSEK